MTKQTICRSCYKGQSIKHHTCKLIQIEPWQIDFLEKINPDNYARSTEKYCENDLSLPNDSLLVEQRYPESEYELDPDKVEAFIASEKKKSFDEGYAKAVEFISNNYIDSLLSYPNKDD